MALTHDTEHVERGTDRLVQVLKKPKTIGLLSSYLAEVQSLEDALVQLLNEKAIDLCEGAGLDVIGRIVGEPRKGKSDPTYRTWLKARILVNRSSGTLPQLLAILELVLAIDDPDHLHIRPYYPKSLVCTVDGLLVANDPHEVGALLREAKSGSEQLDLVYSTAEPTFCFLAYLGADGDGLGSITNPSAGGTFASLA